MILTLIGYLIVRLTVNSYIKNPTTKVSKEKTFVIKNGEGVREISQNLESQGLINSEYLFILYLKFHNKSGQLKAGEYILNTNYSPLQILEVIIDGRVANQRITIPEGWTIDDIAAYLDKRGIVKKADFVHAASKNYDYDFLSDKPNGVDLEGYLFPDTYDLPLKIDSEGIVRLMLDNFDKKLTRDIRSQAAASGKNFHEVLTLASVVEREVAKPDDRKLVAGVFQNRLNIGMRLESCATIQYILKTNKTRFSYEETRVESPYNTYIKDGLPPGPIANPGIDSIKAAITPEASDYYYFLSKDGVTYYSKTQEEHDIKVAEYLN